MKKSLIILVLIFVSLFSCERDDFWTLNPVTPSLVIRFCDANDRDENLQVDSLFVWVPGRADSLLISNAITDSIAIPLNTTALSTTYNFGLGTDLIETITVAYDPQEEFISRSCGFRVIFNDVIVSRQNATWIEDISPENIETINSQNQAHVKIFH